VYFKSAAAALLMFLVGNKTDLEDGRAAALTAHH
jgi:hypothetical protein